MLQSTLKKSEFSRNFNNSEVMMMGKHPDNIKNELAYFYKVIKNMDSYDDTKKSKIQRHEIPIEEVMYDEFSNTSDVDKQLLPTSLLGWIKLVENENLHRVLKSLKIED